MSVFDWCIHSNCKGCIGSYQKFYIGPVGKGRNKKDGPIFLDEIVECECKCHQKGKKK